MDPLDYFAFFKYVPTVTEYLRYSELKRVPTKYQIVEGRVVSTKTKKYLSGTLKREKISLEKIEKRYGLLRWLGRLPQVKYLGISGTVSVLNARPEDDLDLFVITRANSLFTARFLLILFTSLLGVRRRRGERDVKDKLCFNLFISESELTIPKHKQTPYIAHEIGQLWTVMNKDRTYERFLWANRWINYWFKNFTINRVKLTKPKREIDLIEKVMRIAQLWLIGKHRTNELITDTQLWFFPDDFEHRLPSYPVKGLAKKAISL